jgi:head-tail adaptor
VAASGVRVTAAGDLRQRIAFDKRAPADDGYGNTEADFVEQFVVAAEVKAKFGGETVTAARLAGHQPVNVTVRSSTQTRLIRVDWRARDTRTGVVYEIRSIADPTARKAWIELLCEDRGEVYVAPEDNSPSLDFSIAANSMYVALLEDV